MKPRHSGLGMPPLVQAGLLLAQLVSTAPLPNAWQIMDSLATGSALNYATERDRSGPDEFPLGHFCGPRGRMVRVLSSTAGPM
jgi:hypothetical protein